ncbi:uncharacterized protein PV09_02943 [Verruconis gallopava]|uniref:DNA repair protein rhp7 treble clef domain-containing protein n=1 Tax=Verruconis gallopava TaxID=253628 RepID=A0A0D2AJ20_9PEZI|nr:uncharacterized protein PV09_02943 [Verruconis gallopava]KIW06510.1 hypothetical protein PV09_02943 [Verruconis gallopava]
MSGRRGGNRIRGPQSALTDFLAANNISAQQIRDDYQRRRAQVEQDAENENQNAADRSGQNEDDEEIDEEEQAAVEEMIARSRRRRKAVQEEAISKIKSKKDKYRKDKAKAGNSNDESELSDLDNDLAAEFGGYKKAVKLPGQLANCELCDKRFTVTPYSKTGPDGGLLCTPCGKELGKEAEKAKKEQKRKAGPVGRKRRKIESNRLDGNITLGAKTLQQLCVEQASKYADDVDDLGDMPERQMKRLSEIFTKKRVMRPKTFALFLRPENEQITVHDCAYLDHEDFVRMFATSPKLQKLVLDNACQFKNQTMEYMIEKNSNIRWLHLYAANLINNETWEKYFNERGSILECLQLSDLDAFFQDSHVQLLASKCPNLARLKLKRCRSLTTNCLESISQLKGLKHLSLQFSTGVSTPNEALSQLIISLGPQLRTLSLQDFLDADDAVLETLATHSGNIEKLRISTNDTITDAAWARFFSDWNNPPLRFIDVSRTRDVDNNNPDGPLDVPIGLGEQGFTAMMKHSGSKLQYLHITSCRHIPYGTLISIFDGKNQYPELLEVDMSFVSNVDTLVLAGLFKSAPKLRKVVAFGCFGIEDVVVPQNVVVIGVPRAQDAIEKFGVAGLDVEGALGALLAKATAAMDVDVAA